MRHLRSEAETGSSCFASASSVVRGQAQGLADAFQGLQLGVGLVPLQFRQGDITDAAQFAQITDGQVAAFAQVAQYWRNRASCGSPQPNGP